MDELKEGKKRYDSVPVPKELSERVNKAIMEGERKMNGKQKKMSWIKVPATVCAAALCVMIVGLNTNEAFANTMGNIPVIGSVMQLLTINSYESSTREDNVDISLEVPELVTDAETATISENESDSQKVMTAQEIAERMNEEINTRVDAYVADAHARIEEYKTAFLATGGTEAEWNARNFAVDVSYEVKSQQNDILSFAMIYSEDWNSAYGETKYYNINLADGSDITLKDMLGEDYPAVIAESVKKQAEQMVLEDSGKVFWILEDDMGYASKDVFENPAFYINENGNVVVVFPKYSIAPGYMGATEFEIR